MQSYPYQGRVWCEAQGFRVPGLPPNPSNPRTYIPGCSEWVSPFSGNFTNWPTWWPPKHVKQGGPQAPLPVNPALALTKACMACLTWALRWWGSPRVEALYPHIYLYQLHGSSSHWALLAHIKLPFSRLPSASWKRHPGRTQSMVSSNRCLPVDLRRRANCRQ